MTETTTERAIRLIDEQLPSCLCCKVRTTTTKLRDPGHGSKKRMLCDPCWESPTLAYEDCEHGRGQKTQKGGQE